MSWLPSVFNGHILPCRRKRDAVVFFSLLSCLSSAHCRGSLLSGYSLDVVLLMKLTPLTNVPCI